VSPCVRFFNRWVYLGVAIHILHLRTFERFIPGLNSKYFVFPGWHQFLPNSWFAFTQLSLMILILWNLFYPTQRKSYFLTVLIILDYLTFPMRIMNHYTLLVFVLLNQLIWFSFERTNLSGYCDAFKKTSSLMLGIAFFCAGFHKMNAAYLNPADENNTVVLLFRHLALILNLQYTAPAGLIQTVAIISIVIEMSFFFFLLFKTEKNESLISLLFLLFILFLVLVKRIPDYTWIASCFTSLFFNEEKWQRVRGGLVSSKSNLYFITAFVVLLSWVFLRHLGIKMLLFLPVLTLICVLMNGIIKDSKLFLCCECLKSKK